MTESHSCFTNIKVMWLNRVELLLCRFVHLGYKTMQVSLIGDSKLPRNATFFQLFCYLRSGSGSRNIPYRPNTQIIALFVAHD